MHYSCISYICLQENFIFYSLTFWLVCERSPPTTILEKFKNIKTICWCLLYNSEKTLCIETTQLLVAHRYFVFCISYFKKWPLTWKQDLCFFRAYLLPSFHSSVFICKRYSDIHTCNGRDCNITVEEHIGVGVEGMSRKTQTYKWGDWNFLNWKWKSRGGGKKKISLILYLIKRL